VPAHIEDGARRCCAEADEAERPHARSLAKPRPVESDDHADHHARDQPKRDFPFDQHQGGS
jgi:hypothetical protein